MAGTGADPLAKPVAVVADSSSVGSSFSTTATPGPKMLISHLLTGVWTVLGFVLQP